MEWYWVALMLICGIYLAAGVVMLLIYITFEHKTYRLESKFNPFVPMPQWDFIDVPVFCICWPWLLGEIFGLVARHHHEAVKHRQIWGSR